MGFKPQAGGLVLYAGPSTFTVAGGTPKGDVAGKKEICRGCSGTSLFWSKKAGGPANMSDVFKLYFCLDVFWAEELNIQPLWATNT